MRPNLVIASAAVVLLGISNSALADTLVDQLCIVDLLEYDQGNTVGMIGGALLAGMDIDSQLVDDFTVRRGTGEGFLITAVTFDYLAFLGAGSPPSSLIEIFPDDGGAPSEVPVYSAIHSATSTTWTPLQPSLNGERHVVSGLAIPLTPGDYWISMQPITITGAPWFGTGDILWPVQGTNAPSCVTSPGSVTHFREGGIDPDFAHDGSLGFGPLPGGGTCTGGCPDFANLADPRLGLDDGESSFKVEGTRIGVFTPALGPFGQAVTASLMLALGYTIFRRQRAPSIDG